MDDVNLRISTIDSKMVALYTSQRKLSTVATVSKRDTAVCKTAIGVRTTIAVLPYSMIFAVSATPFAAFDGIRPLFIIAVLIPLLFVEQELFVPIRAVVFGIDIPRLLIYHV